jgi:hypothetical protein
MNAFLSRFVLGCLIAGVVTSSSFAAAKKDRSQRDATAALSKKLKKADLPTEAREKANKVLSEYGPKVREATAAREAILTSEQKAARAAAQKAGKEAGKKRKELASEVMTAMKLTDDQKSKYAAAEKELARTQSDMQKALRGILSADEQAKVGLKNRKKKNA